MGHKFCLYAEHIRFAQNEDRSAQNGLCSAQNEYVLHKDKTSAQKWILIYIYYRVKFLDTKSIFGPQVLSLCRTYLFCAEQILFCFGPIISKAHKKGGAKYTRSNLQLNFCQN